MSGVQAKGLAKPADNEGEPLVIEFDRISRSLYTNKEETNESLLTQIMKATEALSEEEVKKAAASGQGVALGRKLHPFNFDLVGRFQTYNVHHARAIHAKVAATVGLGFQTPNDKKRKDAKSSLEPTDLSTLPPQDDVAKIDQVLGPLCEHSWQDTLVDCAEDLWQTGNGFLEVVRRRTTREVLGLYHLAAKEVYVVIENHRYDRHYSIQGREDNVSNRVFAKFGDSEGLLQRAAQGKGYFSYGQKPDKEIMSEVIHFRRPTSLSRWYGYPDWLSAVAAIELVQCLTQHEYDFYLNRGVPEFFLFVIGQLLSKSDKEKIEAAMASTIGLGNQHKSVLVNLPNGGEHMKVQLEKLALEAKGDGSQFAGMSEALALQIVSAHGIPPLLAGIQIPGKLGAANEMVQAMQAFHVLVIEPMQRLIRQTLLNTLGTDSSLGLSPEDFVLNTIVDRIDVQKTDTIARMRQTPQEAADEGRDLDKGVKKSFEGWSNEERAALYSAGIDALLDRLASKVA